jgi:hypothetical protein
MGLGYTRQHASSDHLKPQEPSFREKPTGDGHRLEERGGAGAEALPYDGRPRRSGETRPTTFMTLAL